MTTIAESIQEKVAKCAKWKKNNPGQSWCNPEFPEDEGKIYITRELLASPAFRSLSRAAYLVYLDFLEKRIMKKIRRNGKEVWIAENNGEIRYPYAEAEEEKGFARKTFVKAIDELQSKGLLDITHQGKGGRKPAKGSGDESTYWIDDRWKDYGAEAFRPPRRPRKKDTRQDRGFSMLWKDPAFRKKMTSKKPSLKVVEDVRPEETHAERVRRQAREILGATEK